MQWLYYFQEQLACLETSSEAAEKTSTGLFYHQTNKHTMSTLTHCCITATMLPYDQNFVKKKEGSWIKSNKRGVYESVDEESLSQAISQNLTGKGFRQ